MGFFLRDVGANLASHLDPEVLWWRMSRCVKEISRHDATCAVLVWIDKRFGQFQPQFVETFANSHALSRIGISLSGTGVTRHGNPRVSADPVTGSQGPS